MAPGLPSFSNKGHQEMILRQKIRAVAFGALVVLSACVDGKELIAPEDPRYATMCADTLVVYEDFVCRRGSIEFIIANPLYRPPADTITP